MRCINKSAMNNKEKNFVSAVFYLHNDAERVVPFVSELNAQLDAHFDQYELVAVDDNCTDGTAAVAAAHVGLTSRESDVVMDGGRLHVRWAEDDHVMLSGPAEFVFDGEITL